MPPFAPSLPQMQPCIAVLKIQLTCETIHFVVVVKIQTHSNQNLYMEFKKSYPKTDYSAITNQSVALESFIMSSL